MGCFASFLADHIFLLPGTPPPLPSHPLVWSSDLISLIHAAGCRPGAPLLGRRRRGHRQREGVEGSYRRGAFTPAKNRTSQLTTQNNTSNSASTQISIKLADMDATVVSRLTAGSDKYYLV